jgi:hypothetical protein
MRRWTIVGALASGWLWAAAPGAGGAARSVPARDEFSGSITAASGRFAGDGGRLLIDLAPGPRHSSTRTMTATFRGRRCGTAKHCLRLTGDVKGTLTEDAGQIPDAGVSFAFRGQGSLKPLGHVSAAGQLHGTGFIYRGRETLHLVLTARGGRVTVDARSGTVPGFTSP